MGTVRLTPNMRHMLDVYKAHTPHGLLAAAAGRECGLFLESAWRATVALERHGLVVIATDGRVYAL